MTDRNEALRLADETVKHYDEILNEYLDGFRPNGPETDFVMTVDDYLHLRDAVLLARAQPQQEPVAGTARKTEFEWDEEFINRLAAASAHRICIAQEHNPSQGKLHGCCVVCAEDFPCSTAKAFSYASPPAQAMPTAYAVRYRHALSDVLIWEHPANAIQLYFHGAPLKVEPNVEFYRELFAGPTKTLSAAPKPGGK